MAGIKDTAISSKQLAIGQTRDPKTQKANGKTKANKSKTRKTKTRKKKVPVSPILLTKPIEFPEVKGKTVEEVKLYLHDDDTSISIHFADKTHLNFSLEPRITVRTSLADLATGDWRGIKAWPVMMSESSYIDD